MLTDDERSELLRKKRPMANAPFPKAPAGSEKPFGPAPVESLSKKTESVVSPKPSVPSPAPVPFEEKPPVALVPMTASDEDEELLLATASRVEKETEKRKSFEERPTFPAICDTCGAEIRVPFKPDGKRPTFCKECFKSHQRAMTKPGAAEPNIRPKAVKKQSLPRKERTDEAKSYISEEAPISLSRAALVAPKRFRSLRERPAPDLGAVRDILNRTAPRKTDDPDGSEDAG
jgi:CxxC-x17-CxxC domain-containing protein